MRKLLKLIFSAKLNIIKTLYFNFKVFSFKTAIKLPIWLFGKVVIFEAHRDSITINGKLRRGMIRIGGGVEKYNVPFCQTFVSYINLKGNIIFGSNVVIDNGVCLSVAQEAIIEFGDEVYINANCKIFSEEMIVIGTRSRISWDSQIFDSNFHYIVHNGIINRKSHPIILSQNCWIGNKVTISKGTNLPAYSIVAAGSMINKDFSANAEGGVYAGIPAKLIATKFERLIGKEIEEKIDRLFKDGRETVLLTDIN